jgi:hypothetical protein
LIYALNLIALQIDLRSNGSMFLFVIIDFFSSERSAFLTCYDINLILFVFALKLFPRTYYGIYY